MMKGKSRVGNRRKGEQELADLEARLRWTLKPVQPRRDFARDLQANLLRSDRISVEVRRNQTVNIMIISLGLISGLLALIFGLRALFGLLGGSQALRQQS